MAKPAPTAAIVASTTGRRVTGVNGTARMTAASTKPTMTWNRNKGPIVGIVLKPVRYRSRWIAAVAASKPPPASRRSHRRSVVRMINTTSDGRRRIGRIRRDQRQAGTFRLILFKKVLKSRGRLHRHLLGEVVAAGQRAAVDLDRVLLPDRQHVVVVAADEAVLTPQREQRRGHLLAAGGGRVVVVQVDGGGGTVVLAGGVDRGRVAEAPDVLVECLLGERPAAPSQQAQPAADPALRVGAEQLLGQRLRLGEEEPVPVAKAEL